MLKHVLNSLLVGVLAGGLAYCVMTVIDRWVKKKPVPSTGPPVVGKNEPEKEKETPRAESTKPLRITPQSVWRGGKR